ncbi:hypothetical protein DJ568_15400 [Mucilaginibacter hurinus]|uniref:Uncharacterized protein n=1 Tax=Mucilaginibacter hurinus TaxID=2201324 RepID=A0A367GMJ6_9SPHI|nr:hypothetical protein [Mucilaginibacter hurinus]RCH53923.1 hypothetical protein DJ568_15400 [Mucilaginibacter hurinus]
MITPTTGFTALSQASAGVATADLDSGKLPDLATAVAQSFNLVADYWTPQAAGESKRVFFDTVAMRKVAGREGEGMVDLECAYFCEQTHGCLTSLANGSKRLVNALKTYGVARGTPLLITYLGKTQNKTNAHQSDNWSVRILKLDGGAVYQ